MTASAAKSAWPASVDRSATTFTPRAANSFMTMSRPPLPKSLLTQTTAAVLAFTSSAMYLAIFGIDDCWPNEVRNTNLLPACVSSAASPPMMLAISAWATSGAVTFTEPE